MNFIEFKEQTLVIAKDQPQYLPIPAYKADNSQGEMIMNVEMTPEEKEKFLETGQFWISVWTFGNPLQPLRLFLDSPFREMNPIIEPDSLSLKEMLREGTFIGNTSIGKDVYVFEVLAMNEETVSYKFLNPADGSVTSTHLETYQHLCDVMLASKHPDTWFTINP